MLEFLKKILTSTKKLAKTSVTVFKGRVLDVVNGRSTSISVYAQCPPLLSLLEKFESTVTTNDLEVETYEHGDPRHYIACMVKSLQPGSKLESGFKADLSRISIRTIENGVVTSLDTNIDNRLLFVEQQLEKIAKSVWSKRKSWITKDRLRPIISYLSQGLMAEILSVVNKQLDINFTYGKDVIKANHSLLSYPNSCSSILTFDGNIVRYENRFVGYPFSSHNIDELKRFSEDKVHLNIFVTTTIDFSKLSVYSGKFKSCCAGITQTMNISSDSEDLKFIVSSLIKKLDGSIDTELKETSNIFIPEGYSDDKPFTLDHLYIEDYIKAPPLCFNKINHRSQSCVRQTSKSSHQAFPFRLSKRVWF